MGGARSQGPEGAALDSPGRGDRVPQQGAEVTVCKAARSQSRRNHLELRDQRPRMGWVRRRAGL